MRALARTAHSGRQWRSPSGHTHSGRYRIQCQNYSNDKPNENPQLDRAILDSLWKLVGIRDRVARTLLGSFELDWVQLEINAVLHQVSQLTQRQLGWEPPTHDRRPSKVSLTLCVTVCVFVVVRCCRSCLFIRTKSQVCTLYKRTQTWQFWMQAQTSYKA